MEDGLGQFLADRFQLRHLTLIDLFVVQLEKVLIAAGFLNLL